MTLAVHAPYNPKHDDDNSINNDNSYTAFIIRAGYVQPR